jgi:hypothetical protein
LSIKREHVLDNLALAPTLTTPVECFTSKNIPFDRIFESKTTTTILAAIAIDLKSTNLKNIYIEKHKRNSLQIKDLNNIHIKNRKLHPTLDNHHHPKREITSTTNLPTPQMAWSIFAWGARTHHSLALFLLHSILRAVQVLAGATVAATYAMDMTAAQSLDSRWVYAVVVASLSAASALVLTAPFFRSWLFFAWDWLLLFLWAEVAGIFGSMFMGEPHVAGDAGVDRMKSAVWINLINVFLWFLSGVYGTVMFVCLGGRREVDAAAGRARK